jgi:hypothetical protein
MARSEDVPWWAFSTGAPQQSYEEDLLKGSPTRTCGLGRFVDGAASVSDVEDDDAALLDVAWGQLGFFVPCPRPRPDAPSAGVISRVVRRFDIVAAPTILVAGDQRRSRSA